MSRLFKWSLATLLIVAAGWLMTAPATADWDPDDGHKMHFPQLPDPDGWDVRFHDWWLGDDWQCSETGDVTDIHFWVSGNDYNLDEPPTLGTIGVQVRDNVPAGGTEPFSHPGEQILYDAVFPPDSYRVRHAGSGEQGWYDPSLSTWSPNNHTEYFQVNLTDLGDNLFEQQEGEIYWLLVQLPDMPANPEIGWKSTATNFMDDGVWGNPGNWVPLTYSDELQSMDLAFVITPEPGSLLLLLTAVGMLALARRRC